METPACDQVVLSNDGSSALELLLGWIPYEVSSIAHNGFETTKLDMFQDGNTVGLIWCLSLQILAIRS